MLRQVLGPIPFLLVAAAPLFAQLSQTPAVVVVVGTTPHVSGAGDTGPMHAVTGDDT
jgi:hypothetical protein